MRACGGSSTWAALGQGERLSRHLASRQEVGRILRESGVPTIEFRASIVIGSGSLSFELVRALVEKLPAMVTPSWVDTPTQPIGIEDLVAYLVAALDLPARREHRSTRSAAPTASPTATSCGSTPGSAGLQPRHGCRAPCSRRGSRASGWRWCRRCMRRSDAS